jgi:STE24 endopeptidase
MISSPAAAVRLVYLCLFSAEFLCLQLLTVLNLRAIGSARTPPGLSGRFEAQTLRRSRGYALARGRLQLASAALNAAVLLGLLLSGSLGDLERLSRRLPLPALLQSWLYLLAVSLLIGLASLPVTVYRQFVIERRFGFNTMTPRLFLLDLAKQTAVTLVVSAPLLIVLLWLIEAGGDFWWLYAFALAELFLLALMAIVPRFIAPLFNTFSPLPRQELEERIRAFMEKLGLALSGVFVMDGSRRSKHSNAYFSGLGRTRRIVLFDTLLEILPDEQVVAVLAHELGHRQLRHLQKGMLLSLAGLLASLWLAGRALLYPPLFTAFGFRVPGAAALLVLLAYYSHPLVFPLQPLLAGWSRRRELAADRFALKAGIAPSVLGAALVTLSAGNLNVLPPHRLYSLYHDTHPPLAERLQAIAARGEEEKAAKSPEA